MTTYGCQGSETPCGELPVLTGTLHVTYCRHHRSWWVHGHLVEQADAEPSYLWSGGSSFGPFDTRADVLDWLRRRLYDVVPSE